MTANLAPGGTSGNNEHTEKDVVQGTHLVKDDKFHLPPCHTALRGTFNTVVAWVDLERHSGAVLSDFGGHVELEDLQGKWSNLLLPSLTHRMCPGGGDAASPLTATPDSQDHSRMPTLC